MLFIVFAYICRQYDFDAANIQKKLKNAKKILPRLCNQAEVADPHEDMQKIIITLSLENVITNSFLNRLLSSSQNRALQKSRLCPRSEPFS